MLKNADISFRELKLTRLFYFGYIIHLYFDVGQKSQIIRYYHKPRTLSISQQIVIYII